METSQPSKNWHNSSIHPGAIFVQLTTACNAKCINCPHPFTYGRKGTHPKGVMADNIWDKIIQDIQAMGYRNQIGLYLHHEPLLERTLFRKIRQINDETEAFAVISTNGSLLNEKNRKALIDATPRIVHININSADKRQYERMTGLNFETTINNAKRFIVEASRQIHIEINCPILPEVDIEKLIHLFPDVKVNAEYWANSRGGLLEGITSDNRGSRFKLSDYCLQPEQNFNILFDGSVVLCCLDWAHESRMDFPNVGNSSILEIYNSDLMQKIIHEFKKGNYSRYQMCKHCSEEMGFINKDTPVVSPEKQCHLSKNNNIENTDTPVIAESDNKISHWGKTYEPDSAIQTHGGEVNRKEKRHLNILLTNHHLLDFTGSEVFTFTIADFLKRNGHKVTIYSNYIDRIRKYFDLRGIPITNNLATLKGSHFDVAHVHHNINALEVRYFFPRLPIVFLSHGVLPFLEQPPQIDIRISKFLAVSEEVKNNLITKVADKDTVDIYRNIVDSDIFRPRSKINNKPRNALILSNRIDTSTEHTIREACNLLNIECTFIGSRFSEIDYFQVPNVMNQADIVFSLGRGAVEAAMCARIPIVYDYQGGDGLVRPGDLQDIMKCNFSGRSKGINFSVKTLVDEIRKYKAEYGEELREIACQYFNAEFKINELIEIYHAAIKDDIRPLTSQNQALLNYIISSIIESRSYTQNYLKRKNVRTPVYNATNRIESFKHICSIIIPVFNKVEFTRKCLEALIENTPDGLYEVIIVDNASSDGTHEFLTCLEGDVKIITNETNLGFAKACNQGAHAASGKYLVFLNNDTIPLPGWLSELVSVADKHDDIGIVGSKLLFPDGTLQHAGVVLVETPSGKLGNHLYWGYPGDFPPANKARDFQVVTAACMLMPGDLFFNAGGFDERYINGMEDVDLCLRIKRSGKRVFYCPNSVLTHFESKTEGRFDRVNDNEKLFVQLWDDKIQADKSKYLIEDGFRIEQVNGKVSWIYHEELSNKLLSVIINTYNSLPAIQRSIENIISCTSMPVEIIIVDNHSTDGTKDYLKTLCDINTISLNEKTNSDECFYMGLKEARGDYIAFLSPEVILSTGWDTQFILSFKETAGAVSAFIYKYDELLNFKDLITNPLNGEIDLNYFASMIARWNKNKCEEKGILDPQCYMIKKSLIERIDMLDSGLKNNFDKDLSLRMNEAGYEIIRATGALVYTHEPSQPYAHQNSSFWENKNSISQSIGIPLTSIVILTFNQINITKKCLNSILEYTNIPYELILVDNGSTDGTKDYLREFARVHKNVELISNKKNLGFAAGNNQGIEKAHGDYILLLNNDVVVAQGWLERMISHLEQSPDIGMVGPMSNSVSGAQLVKNVPYKNKLNAMQNFAQEFAKNNQGKTTEVMRLVGFCLLIRKEVLEVIGGLDENYGSGNFEDDDLCLRSCIAGYKNIIAGDVFIHHFGSMTFKGNSIDYAATMKKNLSYFGEKWKDIIEINNDTGYRIHATKEQQIQKLICWGEEKYASGDLRSAVKLFRRVLMLDRRNSQALSNLGVIQWQLGETTSAVDIFQKALFLDPNDTDALANLVQAVEEIKRADLVQNNLIDLLRQSQPANPDLGRLIDGLQGNV